MIKLFPSQPRGDFITESSEMNLDPRYLEAIQEQYPASNAGSLRVFDDGWDYLVCVVAGAHAFRFPRRAEYARQLPAEVTFLQQFAPLCPVRVPLSRLGHLKEGTPFAEYEFIPGVPFTPQLAADFTSAELAGIAAQLGGFLSALHSLPAQQISELGFRSDDPDHFFMEKSHDIHKNLSALLSAAENRWLQDRLEAYREITKKNPPALVPTHSDLLPEHMIVDPQRHCLNGVIDYGDLAIFDPAVDFTYLGRYGERFLQAVYEHYSQPQDETFEIRRRLYNDFLHVTNLNYAVEKNEPANIQKFKLELSNHIAANQILYNKRMFFR